MHWKRDDAGLDLLTQEVAEGAAFTRSLFNS